MKPTKKKRRLTILSLLKSFHDASFLIAPFDVVKTRLYVKKKKKKTNTKNGREYSYKAHKMACVINRHPYQQVLLRVFVQNSRF